eukprot:1119621-Rhodomonas_salina.2
MLGFESDFVVQTLKFQFFDLPLRSGIAVLLMVVCDCTTLVLRRGYGGTRRFTVIRTTGCVLEERRGMYQEEGVDGRGREREEDAGWGVDEGRERMICWEGWKVPRERGEEGRVEGGSGAEGRERERKGRPGEN